MRRTFALLAIVIFCAPPIIAQADDPPPAGERTSAEAKCAWGSNIGGAANLVTYNKIYPNASEWRRENGPIGECNLGVVFLPNMLTSTFSSLTAFAAIDANRFTPTLACRDGNDPACDPNKWAIIREQSTIYKCAKDTDLNCVLSLSATDPSGNKPSIKYLRSFPDDTVREGFKGPIINYPAGGNPSIWSLSTPSGEVRVLLYGLTTAAWESHNGSWVARPGNQFQLSLVPIKEVPIPASMSGSNCIAADKETCLMVEPSLPKGYVFNVSLNLADNVTLFLNGRLDNPIVYTERIGNGHRLTIEAAPSPALSVAQWVPKSIVPKSTIDGIFKNVGGTWFNATFDQSNSEFRLGGEQGSVEFLNALLPYIGDRVSYEQSVWTVSNNPSSDNYNQDCRNESRGEILGIVSTNATAYRGDPPSYNKSTSALEYEVSAPHFMPDGKTESVGRYAINMNAKFLECILGVSQVPATATVGLSYGSGEMSVTTLAVNQDKNWLRVHLDNFHYSAPKISIKFKSATPMPKTEVNSPIKIIKIISKTISCKRGKTVKKITSVKPVCPVGYTLVK